MKTAPEDLCARCKQPVPRAASRCPYCATPHKNNRSVTLWFGAAIVLALVFVMGIMVYSIRLDDFMKTPPEGADKAAPAQPDKPPPLSQ